jgi:hypothetical protein
VTAGDRLRHARGHGEKWTRKHHEAVLALVSAPTVTRAAEQIGVSEKTLWRWMQREDFREQYRAARRQVVDVALINLQQAAGEAVETLRCNLTCGTPSVEVRAAVAILEQTLKAVELEDLDVRLKALEQHMEATAEQEGRGRQRGI